MPDSKDVFAQALGIPLAFQSSASGSSARTDSVALFLTEFAQTKRALRLMGVEVSDALGIWDGIQYFALVNRIDPAASVSVEKCAAESDLRMNPAPEVEFPKDRVSVCLDALQTPAADDVDALEEVVDNLKPHCPTSPDLATPRDLSRMRLRVMGGPEYVVLGGVQIPWAANFEEPEGGQARADPEIVTLEPAGRELHLLADSGRYRSDDASDMSAMQVGATVAVVTCLREQALFARAEDLIRQGELGF